MQAAEEAADAVDWDDAVGISMPLYTLVDVLFELQSRGFFRRQARPLATRQHRVSWQLRCAAGQGALCGRGLRAHPPHVVAEYEPERCLRLW